MILEYKALEIFGKKVFEKAVVKPPFRNINLLQDEACFLFILEGENNSFSEKEHIVVKQNEGLLMKCGNYMYDGRADKVTGNFGLLAIHFYPEVLKKIYKKGLPEILKKSNERKYSSNMVLIKANHLIKKFIDDMLFYLDTPELYEEELIVLKMKEIIMLLLKSKNAPIVLDIINNFFSNRTYRIREVVESHIFSPITINDLAQLSNNSLASFKRKFKEIYNDSPANYIKSKRLERAAELLVMTDDTVSAIAYTCQFNDTSHFSRTFKLKYNQTPGEYRMSQLYNK